MPVPGSQSDASALDRKIGIGELGVLKGKGVLKTLLGSCVGLVLYDPRMQVGGLAHIVLPKAERATDLLGKYADTALPELIRLIQRAGGRPDKLVAKLAGGANMFASNKGMLIGDLNVAAVLLSLAEAEIPVLGQHCGGGQGRRVTYDVATGNVVVEVVGQAAITF